MAQKKNKPSPARAVSAHRGHEYEGAFREGFRDGFRDGYADGYRSGRSDTHGSRTKGAEVPEIGGKKLLSFFQGYWLGRFDKSRKTVQFPFIGNLVFYGVTRSPVDGKKVALVERSTNDNEASFAVPDDGDNLLLYLFATAADARAYADEHKQKDWTEAERELLKEFYLPDVDLAPQKQIRAARERYPGDTKNNPELRSALYKIYANYNENVQGTLPNLELIDVNTRISLPSEATIQARSYSSPGPGAPPPKPPTTNAVSTNVGFAINASGSPPAWIPPGT